MELAGWLVGWLVGWLEQHLYCSGMKPSYTQACTFQLSTSHHTTFLPLWNVKLFSQLLCALSESVSVILNNFHYAHLISD
jgi:hypothetical protein